MTLSPLVAVVTVALATATATSPTSASTAPAASTVLASAVAGSACGWRAAGQRLAQDLPGQPAIPADPRVAAIRAALAYAGITSSTPSPSGCATAVSSRRSERA